MTIDRQTIKYMIDERGTQVTFRRVQEGAYDPSTGQTGASTTDDETVKVVFTNYSEREITDSNIQRGDRKVLMSNYDTSGSILNKEPQVDDKFVGESSTVTVVDARTLRDAGVVVGYVVQVRE
jgi:hypothetical protein